jgi:hypothetical protein
MLIGAISMSIYEKICKNCQRLKSVTAFVRHKQSPDGYHYRCNTCISNKNYVVDDNYEVITYTSEDIIKIKQQQKQLSIEKSKEKYNKNIDFHRNIRRIKINGRLKQDPLFKLRHNLKNLIRNSIKGQGYNKYTKTAKILGCSYLEFKIHIEQQFAEGMSWQNYGKWEYDHVTPVSWGITEEEIIVLNHYTNFQPLWKEANRSKSNKFSGRTL